MDDDLLSKVTPVGEVLNDPDKSLAERFRALFTLRNIGGEEAIQWINKCFSDPSTLLKHELAYCLGQMRDERALPYLEAVLRDTTQEAMVRHEAGEAIGAIGCADSVAVLEEFSRDPVRDVAETCEVARERILALTGGGAVEDCVSPYDSVDPAPSAPSEDVDQLKGTLLDDGQPLFTRYRAMFALRNIKSDQAVLALCQGLSAGSALFRHEVAFVLGQLQSPLSVGSLEGVLRRGAAESPMVRHEAAEALGSIATPSATALLREFLSDPEPVVAQSCQVALDMAAHETSGAFQYADTALKV